MSRFALGVDVGSARDPTTLVVVERVGRVFDAVHLERLPLGLSHPDIVRRIAEVHDRLWHVDGELVLDATGVGAATRDMLRERGARVVAVTFTSGEAERKLPGSRRFGEDWRVARASLFRGLASAVFSGRLRIARALPAAAELVRELAALEVHVGQGGRERVDVPASADHHADLVVALALALWRLHRPRGRVQFGRHDLLRR